MHLDASECILQPASLNVNCHKSTHGQNLGNIVRVPDEVKQQPKKPRQRTADLVASYAKSCW